ncbi:hypothetical protein ABK040_005505 [Willaertia magna]
MSNVLLPKTNYCQKHDLNTDVVCKTCSVVICCKCGLVEHKSHNTVLIEECVMEDTEKYMELLRKQKEEVESIKKRKLDIENTIAKVGNQEKSVEKEIKHIFRLFKKRVVTREQNELQKLKNYKDSQNELLINEKRCLEESLRFCDLNPTFQPPLDLPSQIELETNLMEIENNNENCKKFQEKNKLFNYARFYLNSSNYENIISDINNVNCIENNKAVGFSNKFTYVGQFGKKSGVHSKLNYPISVKIDNSAIYVSDSNNQRIVVYNVDKTVTDEIVLSFEPSVCTLDRTNDTLLIGYYWDNIIVRYDKKGKLLGTYGSRQYCKNSKISVTGIAVDESSGQIFVTCCDSNKILVLSKEGKLIKEITNNLERPRGIVINTNNQLVVTDESHQVKLFTKEGQYISSFGGQGKEEGELRNPLGIIHDFINNRYVVCDSLNNRLSIFKEDGSFVKCLGKQGTGRKEFNNPSNADIDYNTGYLYVVDTNNNCIKIFK